MRGELSETGLGAVLRDLARSDATGALHLDGPSGSAKIFLQDGEVCFASSPASRAQLGARLVGAGFITDEELDEELAAQDRGPTRVKLGALLVDRGVVRRDVIRVFVQEQILDAVVDLARWDDGSFEFFRGDAVSEELPVQVGIEPLLLEVDRRLAEWDDIRAVIPSLEAVPDFSPGGSTTRAALEPDEFTVLTSVDGRRSVRELAHDLGYSQFDAARLVYGLSLLGIIGVRNGEATGTAEPDAVVADVAEPQSEAPVSTAEPAREEVPTPEVEDVDIGRALEEALFGMGYPEEPEDGAADVDEIGPPLDEAVEGDLDDAVREGVTATSDIEEERDEDELVGADDLEPEVWTASIDVDEDDVPAPADEAVETRELQSTGPEPAEREPTGPAAVPAEASDDTADARNELMALMNELRDEDEAPDRGEREQATPTEEAPAPEPTAEEPAAAAPDEGEPEQERRVERGDVSELLRELSRLAGGGPEPVAPSPGDGPEADDEDGDEDEDGEEPVPEDPQKGTVAPPPRSSEDRSRSQKKKEEDDADRKSTFRRLFGSR